MFTFSLNGEPRSSETPLTVAALILELELTGRRIAVECNGEIVPKSTHGNRLIEEGDRLEIVAAVGGG